jgi:hypothetical protein
LYVNYISSSSLYGGHNNSLELTQDEDFENYSSKIGKRKDVSFKSIPTLSISCLESLSKVIERLQYAKNKDHIITTPLPLLLFLGPSGCGKSITVKYLVSKLQQGCPSIKSLIISGVQISSSSNHGAGTTIRTIFNHVHTLSLRAKATGGYFILVLDNIDEAIYSRSNHHKMSIRDDNDDMLNNYDSNLIHVLLNELRNNFPNLCVILTSNLLIYEIDSSLLDRYENYCIVYLFSEIIIIY